MMFVPPQPFISASHRVTDMKSSTANAVCLVFITMTTYRNLGRHNDGIRYIWPSVPLAANLNGSRDRARVREHDDHVDTLECSLYRLAVLSALSPAASWGLEQSWGEGIVREQVKVERMMLSSLASLTNETRTKH